MQQKRHKTTRKNIARLQAFEQEILIVCEVCGKRAVISHVETRNTAPTTRLAEASCPHCGRIWQLPYASPDALRLWLEVDFRGKRVWALNERHLSWLESFVAAELREDSVGGSSALHATLPRWMTSAKNRAGVGKALARLRHKLSQQ